jgi:SAM-dependent methyltransferase
MRDVVTGFYLGTLLRLVGSGAISLSDRVLVVCGGPLDHDVVLRAGFREFVITGMDAETRQDAERLSYPDGAFDVVIVHAGLHHCFSPHRALLECYRVARRAVIAFESRDSLLMRAAVFLGLTLAYETNSITPDGRGGVAETGIPNFIYRWTEREVQNVIASYDPVRAPNIRFFYDFRVPVQRLAQSGRTALRAIALCIEPFSRLIAAIAPRQCNEFAFAVFKNGPLHQWTKAP